MSSDRTANAVDAWLGQRVRARRVEISMTQERLAELLGITFQQVQKYERGVNRIAASRLYEICKVLDVPASELMEGFERALIPKKEREEQLAQFLNLPEAAELVAFFTTLSSTRVRRRVVELVRAMASEQAGNRFVRVY